MNGIYLVCYEPNVAKRIMNRVEIFKAYKKAKAFAESLASKNEVCFICKGKQKHGIIVSGEILNRY